MIYKHHTHSAKSLHTRGHGINLPEIFFLSILLPFEFDTNKKKEEIFSTNQTNFVREMKSALEENFVCESGGLANPEQAYMCSDE